MVPTQPTRSGTSPKRGPNAIADGFQYLGFKGDHKVHAAERIVYGVPFGPAAPFFLAIGRSSGW